MKNLKQKSQSWSIDIAVGVIIFIAAFLVFYTLFNTNPNTQAANLKQEASTVIKQIASEDATLKIVDNNEINISKINELKNMSYDELKRILRVEGDFCLYLEDDKGYVILINDSYKGVGAPTINVSGTPCSVK